MKTILSTESRAPFVISLAYEIDDSGDNVSLWYDGKFHVIAKTPDHAMGEDYGHYAATIRGIAPREMEAI